MDRELYIDTVKVYDWLTNDKEQIIRFKDRIEFRIDGELSRVDGPAITYFDGKEEYYYLGRKLDENEFSVINKQEKIKQI